LQEQLTVELPVVEMFSYPTVKALSTYIMGLSNAQETAAEQAQLRAENRSQGKSVMMQRRQKRGR